MPIPSTPTIWQSLPDTIRQRFVSASSQASSRGRAVYRTYDSLAQRPVAIKAYVHEKPTHSQALVDEYTRLRALDHRNIVQALELFRDEAGIARAFSMEWLEGLSPIQWVWRDLSEGDPHALSELQTLDFDDGLVLKHVRDRAKTNVKGGRASSIADLEVHRLSMRERERLEHLAAQLFDALAYLREAHVIHGDIKHSNLRVIDGGRLVLFDFGAVPLLREQLAAYEFSPDYAAPEVLHGALPTFSSEVYSAAVVLFETATRRRFCTSSRKSFHFRLRELRRSGVDISLARGIATCLSSDPRNRPLASEFQRWFARRRLRFSGALSHENLSDQGTQQQVAEVVSARLRETAGELVVLMGDTGTAKTTIAAQIVSAWTDQPRSLVIWIGGQPSNQDSYHSLRDLVQGLEDASRAIDAPGLRDAWHEAENDPVFRALMRRRHVIEPDPLALHLSSDTQAQFRVLDRIGRLFQLVSQAHELLVVFDDLEWLDADSYLAFQTMMTRPQSPPRVRFLVTTRPSSSTFQRLDQVVEAAGRPIFLQRLEPLTPRDQFLLVQEIIGEAPSDALMTSLHSVCRGHASMLTWVSRWLVEAERIEGPPPSLSEIVAAKLDALLDHERQLIELMAVANHPLPTRVLAHFADEPILEVITKLEVLGLVEPLSPRSPDEYTLPQATLRHVILAGLNDEKQQELLTLLVPVLASEMRASSEYIGKLWIRLGHEKEGRKWLLQAAHDAHRQLGFFKAAELYREVLARSPQEERPAIHLQLAEAYEQLGELTRAAGHLLEASRQVETGRSIDLRTQAAELLFTAGADARARHVLERVLENLNCAPYPGMLKQGRTWLKERGAFLRYIESNDILTLLEERSASDSWHLRRIKAYHLASTVLGQHSLPRALFYHQQSARLTLRGAPAPLVRAVLGWEMVFVAMPGPIFRGQLVALQTAFDTLSEAPFSLTARDRMHMLLLSGTAALGIGRTSDAIRHYERTLTIYFEEYVGAPWTALT